MEAFFGGFFNDNVVKFRYVIIILVLIWSIISIVFTSMISPMTEEIAFMPDDYWTEKAFNLLKEGYYSGETDIAIEINFFWGVAGLDISERGMWDPKDLGKLKWDSDFDITRTDS